MAVVTTTIAQLGTEAAERVQDPTFTFWLQRYEVYAAISEALNELMLLVGRPTLQTSVSITLTPNTCWQPMPANMLAMTDLSTAVYKLWKTTLHSMDYTQTSWGSDWTQDRAADIARWGQLGMTYFFVHPAPVQPIQVNVTGVCSPIQEQWPPVGTETSPFHMEFDQALTLYAASYLRFKDQGDDFLEGQQLYKAFLDLAQRMTQIEDRKDDLVWSQAFGVPSAPSQVTKR